MQWTINLAGSKTFFRGSLYYLNMGKVVKAILESQNCVSKVKNFAEVHIRI